MFHSSNSTSDLKWIIITSTDHRKVSFRNVLICLSILFESSVQCWSSLFVNEELMNPDCVQNIWRNQHVQISGVWCNVSRCPCFSWRPSKSIIPPSHTHTHTHTHANTHTHAHTPQLPHQRCERGKHLHLPYFQSRSLFVHLQPEISLLDTSVSCTFKRTTPWRPINPKPSLTLDNTWNTYWSDSVWLTLPEDIMISYFHPGKTSNNSQRNHWRNLIQNLFFMFFSFLKWESDPETVSLRLCAHC